MSKQRIRRRGADGHDLIFDVDLGPDSAETTGAQGASTMGDMRPILGDGANTLRNVAVGSSWRVARKFIISGREQRSDLERHKREPGRPDATRRGRAAR